LVAELAEFRRQELMADAAHFRLLKRLAGNRAAAPRARKPMPRPITAVGTKLAHDRL
jgi:hypothetical protein